jgi:pimeloyl-ACP methyl ester carboxylesterase
MTRTRILRAVVLLLVIAGPLGAIGPLSLPDALGQAKGPLTRQGVLEGVPYRLQVPAGWNGGLVIFAHGYDGEGPGALSTEPLAAYLAEQGYAWAASGYRSRGYRPDYFIADSLALRDLFLREIGPPRWTIIHGQSMGGHVAIASLELHPGVYQGALIECGIIDGIGMIDLFFAYRAAAEYISGIDLYNAPDQATLSRRLAEQWLPLMGTPGAYTAKGRQFDSVIKHLMGGDLPLRLQGLKKRWLPNLSRFVQPDEPIARAGSTLHVRYRVDPGLGVDEAELNAKIRRKAPAPGARSRSTDPAFAAFAELTGRITAPVLAIHETGDARVPFAVQQNYRRRTLAAGTADLLVQRAVRWPGHCVFDGEVREQAFDDLVVWIERGTKPPGDDVLAADMATLGRRWTAGSHPEDLPAR